jgi:hypothetical protein
MSCWSHQKVAAAKIRDLQSRLMVAALRCRAVGIDVLPAYNDFVIVTRDTLQAANTVLRAQFASAFGAEGEQHYDSYTTALANAYGGDETNDVRCGEAASAAAEASAAKGDLGTLLLLADRLGLAPDLPGGTCPVTFSALE